MPHRYFLFKKHTIQFRFFLIFIFNKKSFIINTRNMSIDFLQSYQSYKVIIYLFHSAKRKILFYESC